MVNRGEILDWKAKSHHLTYALCSLLQNILIQQKIIMTIEKRARGTPADIEWEKGLVPSFRPN